VRVRDQSLRDRLKHAIHVGQDVVVPKSENSITFPVQPSCSARVCFKRVLPAIGPHNQSPLDAAEISDVRAECPLTLEFEAK
jgi:hypothetical protein